MSRFPKGWRTTLEAQDRGYPVRYWWGEDAWVDVAWCKAQSYAAVACSALNAAGAEPEERVS